MTFISSVHRKMLLDSAIGSEVIEASGIRSTPKGLEFPWTDGVGPIVWQSRPDEPSLDEEGRPMKYLFPKGAAIPFNRLRDGETYAGQPLIITEGTKQSYAVLTHAPAHMAVYGMSGCFGWAKADLSVARDRDVYVLADADFKTNVDVYNAVDQLAKKLKLHGAKKVRFVVTLGTGKEGIDDVLAGLPAGDRADMLRRWLDQAESKLGKKPAPKKRVNPDDTDGPGKYFMVRDKPLHLKAAKTAADILEDCPAAVTAEGGIAMYRDGVYAANEDVLLTKVFEMFQDAFNPGILKNATMSVQAMLNANGQRLPERMTLPLLNCANTMVNLRTGDLVDHDPKYMSVVQVPVDYDPDATAPLYEAWLREALRQDGASEADIDQLVDDIEETAGTMLDPSKTPSKALFLFGPSRSGKSTFLRLLKAIAGARNTSAVTLHDLADNPFASANLYGKMLNVAADLSNKHVSDLSIFKMVTGEDEVYGNRKYGKDFSFTNQALMAFSANELPTVSEASRAYTERMKPFEFPNSFAGREDKTLEEKLMAELPGILSRWVKAYSRFLARGGYRPTDRRTLHQFEAKSDRVVQFVQDMCTVVDARPGQRMSKSECTKRRDVGIAFNEWAERNGSSKMGERAFFQRMAAITDIETVTGVDPGNKRTSCFNVVVAKAGDIDAIGDDVPELDPIEASGVVDESDPWTMSEAERAVPQAPVSLPVVSVDTTTLEGAKTEADDFSLTASAAPADPFSDFMNMDLGYEI